MGFKPNHRKCPLKKVVFSQCVETAIDAATDFFFFEGYIIYFHLNTERKYHTLLSPFQEECILISNLSFIHPVYVCTHTDHSWEGNQADLVLLPIPPLKRA